MILGEIEVWSVAKKVGVVIVKFGILRENTEPRSMPENKLNIKLSPKHASTTWMTHFNKLSRDSQSWFLVIVFKQKKQSSINPDTCNIRLIFVIFSWSSWTP